MNHYYIQGYKRPATEEEAAAKVASGEWVVCNAEHRDMPAGECVVYHRNMKKATQRASRREAIDAA